MKENEEAEATLGSLLVLGGSGPKERGGPSGFPELLEVQTPEVNPVGQDQDRTYAFPCGFSGDVLSFRASGGGAGAGAGWCWGAGAAAAWLHAVGFRSAAASAQGLEGHQETF